MIVDIIVNHESIIYCIVFIVLLVSYMSVSHFLLS